MHTPTSTIAAAVFMLSTISLGADSAWAQSAARAPGTAIAVPINAIVTCPNPYHYTVTRPTVPGSQMAGVTGTYNQRSADHTFTDVFVLPPAPKGECCQFQTGTLTVTYKALQGGPANSSSSANDDGGVGGPVNWTRVWLGNTGSVATGAVKTISYPISAAMIASGQVPFGVEDDTAVVSATLDVSGCCVTPSR